MVKQRVEKPVEENDEPESEVTAEVCGCNALPGPHVHDKTGIHFVE